MVPSHGAASDEQYMYAAFLGPVDHFLYLDSDLVVLGGLDELFEGFRSLPCDLMYTDTDPAQVYRTPEFREKMISRHRSKAFNSGAFLSRNNLFTFEVLEQLAWEAARHREHFAPTGDQPFLNYAVDVGGLETRQLQEVVPDLAPTWAGQPRIERRAGGYVVPGRREKDPPKRMPFMHWAGFPLHRPIPHLDIFLSFRLRAEPNRYRKLLYWLGLRGRQLVGGLGELVRWNTRRPAPRARARSLESGDLPTRGEASRWRNSASASRIELRFLYTARQSASARSGERRRRFFTASFSSTS